MSALALAAIPVSSEAKAPSRPNVVMFVTDDQATQMVRPDTMPSLHNLIAPNATKFTDAIVTTPLCCPSRASMLTGQYGHNNGVLRNDYRQLDERNNTLPVWLSRAGYRTIHVGKYLNLYRKASGPEAKPAPGWDVWQTVQEPINYYDYDWSANGDTVHFGSENRDYLTDVINRKAVSQVHRFAPQRKPFYLQLDEYAPHDSPGRGTGPCHTNNDPVPAPTEENLFSEEELPRPPSFNEYDVRDKPSFMQHQLLDVKAVTRNYRCGLASIRAVDRGIRQVHRALSKAGELNDTVFIFASDNGYYYGEHRLRYKLNPYEEGLRIPLMIAVPPRFLSGGGRVPTIGEPVANIDFAPTILDLAGASPCRKRGVCRLMDGRSLMPLLRGSAAWPHDRALMIEYDGKHKGFSSCAYQGVRVPGQVYIEHSLVPNFDTGECVPSNEAEYYDLDSDPYQLENTYPAPPLTPEAERQRELELRLDGLRGCNGVAGRDTAKPGRPLCE